MTTPVNKRGGAPVGFLTDLDRIEATSILYLRLWSSGHDAQSKVRTDLTDGLGHDRGHRTFQSFEDLSSLCARHGRRPLARHAVQCRCIGSDELCFANFMATATDGDREDALLIATLLVRADVAPLIASLATNFGLALRRMHLSAPPDIPILNHASKTLH